MATGALRRVPRLVSDVVTGVGAKSVTGPQVAVVGQDPVRLRAKTVFPRQTLVAGRVDQEGDDAARDARAVVPPRPLVTGLAPPDGPPPLGRVEGPPVGAFSPVRGRRVLAGQAVTPRPAPPTPRPRVGDAMRPALLRRQDGPLAVDAARLRAAGQAVPLGGPILPRGPVIRP